jgi:ATP-dependent helicase/nuclease subunit A
MQQLAAARRGDPPAGPFDSTTRLLAEAVLARDQRLGWGLLEHPSRLNISTIDALCTQIARSLPVLSGGGGQSPVEDSGELYAEAARRTLTLLGGPDPALTSALELVLLHRDGNLAECENLIAQMLAWRDQWGDLIPLTGQQLTDTYLETVTLPRLERALDQAICRALARIARILPTAIFDRLCALASEMAHAEGYKGAPSPIAICKGRNQSPREKAEDLDHWRALAHLLVKPSKPRDWRKAVSGNIIGFEILKHHQADLKNIIAQLDGHPDILDALYALTTLPPVKYPQEQWLVAKALFRILSRALVELQIVFAERGECDFTQFSLLAREALRQATALDDLAASAGFNLEHLLVDEMQDTSNPQYELLHLLTQRWDSHSQTVFLVGDPKQSIYLFRQARVARFLDTLRTARLGDLPLTPLYLTANFRSQANLVDSFNDTFTPIFPPPQNRVPHPREAMVGSNATDSDTELVPYRPAHPTRPRSPGPDLVWHAAAIPHSPDKAICAQARKRQTHRHTSEIRRLVEQWQARPLPPDRTKPWQIAVLVRNRKHLTAVVAAFKEGDPISFRAIKTEPLAERQEVLDLLTLTRALLHPADRTAWLALLRTPWCGLTLRDIHLLAGQDQYQWHEHTILTLIEGRGHELSEDGLARLEPLWTVIAAALAERGRLPLSQWVARTWRAFAADAFTSPEELANVQHFLQLLDELEARPGPITIARLEQGIAKLYAAESTQPGAVDLMTIHNAKGLEWDFVLVPHLEGSAGKSPSRLLTWLEIEGGDEEELDAAHGIIAPVQPKGSEAHALNQWMRSIESAREAAERKRLFYVACTRAKEELHLFAAPDRKKDGDIGRKYDSLLAAAWPAAEPFFEDATEVEIPEPGILDIAAAANLALVQPPPPRTIDRIPLSAFPTFGCPISDNVSSSEVGSTNVAAPFAFDRPEGSFEARAFGNAMHAFLELLAHRIAAGASSPALLAELPQWTPRIAAVLRSSGLAPDEIPRAAANLLRGLTRTLQDADGQWLLAPHPESASESALTSDTGTIRLDRTFLAGATPQSQGSTHLWIVDFKTGTHGTEGLEAFLAREREKYTPQLETYGRHLAERSLPIRLALYYPTLAKLLWWPFPADN